MIEFLGRVKSRATSSVFRAGSIVERRHLVALRHFTQHDYRARRYLTELHRRRDRRCSAPERSERGTIFKGGLEDVVRPPVDLLLITPRAT